ncbi:hypothetical protein ACHAQA_005305 [Verticillium albo-atrum]
MGANEDRIASKNVNDRLALFVRHVDEIARAAQNLDGLLSLIPKLLASAEVLAMTTLAIFRTAIFFLVVRIAADLTLKLTELAADHSINPLTPVLIVALVLQGIMALKAGVNAFRAWKASGA